MRLGLIFIGMNELANCNAHSLFGGFSAEDLERVAPLFQTRGFALGERLVTEGTPNDTLFFLLSGSVRVTRGDRVLIEFHAGDSFGELEMLDTKPAAATITALETVRASCLGHKGLYELYRLDTKLYSIFMMNLARDLARRLRRMDELAVPE